MTVLVGVLLRRLWLRLVTGHPAHQEWLLLLSKLLQLRQLTLLASW